MHRGLHIHAACSVAAFLVAVPAAGGAWRGAVCWPQVAQLRCAAARYRDDVIGLVCAVVAAEPAPGGVGQQGRAVCFVCCVESALPWSWPGAGVLLDPASD